MDMRRMTIILISLSIILLASNQISYADGSDPPTPQRLAEAASYLVERYNPTIGLVSESEDQGSNVPDGTPCYRTFWIYSDNLWAQDALRPFYLDIADDIIRTMAPYLESCGKSQLFEVVLGETIPTQIHGGSNISVGEYMIGGSNHTLWCDRHQPQDGDVFDDANEYADLSFYMALNHHLMGNGTASELWFRNGEAMWRNYGFMDKAAEAANGTFQNYKLGLYLFAVNALGFTSAIYDEVERVAWSYQKENGGIASQSYFNGTIYGTANVETTSALLLAYNEEVLQRFRGSNEGSSYIFMWSIVVFSILATIILISYMLRRKT
jgi:hypothetical protein